MAAPQRVNLEEIREALTAYGGNVTAAAERLGITRNGLHKRLELAGLDVREFRPKAQQQARPGASVALRVSKEAQDALREAAFDLAFWRRREHTPSEVVLEQLVSEALPPWLASKRPGGAR
jgi:DNA-binding transcriptional LysR family regulator